MTEKRKHLCPQGEVETRAGLAQQVTELDLDQELLVEPGPSTSVRASLSFSPLPSGARVYRPTTVSLAVSIAPIKAVEHLSGGGATFTPDMVQKWISEVALHGFEVGRQQHKQPALWAEAPTQGTYQAFSAQKERLSQQSAASSSSSASVSGTNETLSFDEGHLDRELSDDEGLLPDQPVFKGLFRPHLFKTLLFKAKVSTKLGSADTRPGGSITEQDPADLLFSEPVTETDAILMPPLFLDPETVGFPGDASKYDFV